MAIAAILWLSLHSLAAEPAVTPEQACRAFLEHLPEVHYAETGTQVDFTGEFLPIPPPLQAELAKQFPRLSFHIAKMTFIHWGPEPVRLLLVVNKIDNRVRTFLWDLWFTHKPFSFQTTFDSLGDAENVRGRLAALATLLAFQMDWKAGEIKESNGVMLAPLIDPRSKYIQALQFRLKRELTERAFDIVPWSGDDSNRK